MYHIMSIQIYLIVCRLKLTVIVDCLISSAMIPIVNREGAGSRDGRGATAACSK